MPTLANARYPKPTSWDEFEDICLSSFKTRWKNPNLQRHGRQGQAQLGVDIYGDDNLSRLVGVQCKNTIHSISRALVAAEITEAEKFKPALQSLFIATTADTDKTLQAHVRTLSVARAAARKFTVDIVFWDAIEHDLSGDRGEVAKHYQQFFHPSPVPTPTPLVSSSISLHRARDIQNLTRLLSIIDIDATHHYLQYAPKYVDIKFLDHTRPIASAMGSNTFGLYDAQLKIHLSEWIDQWMHLAGLIRSTQAYDLIPGGSTLRFKMPGDYIWDPAEQEQYDLIEDADKEFFRLQQVFCDLVRGNYPEIDLSQTSLAARKIY
ncbi:hypothetical protein [Achromobacter spanius]|uniref:Restriction endonuclease type IV Mrr domain-containing protein n=1 Tax=Achromobacter spanius TaxID=217203 RepID=A0AAW3HX86_9BURK|nr:hypothetical protein [Achromobacter spanius]KNE24871.1 hypothetical protein AFM18_23885 [Achromobacter spanius]